MNNWYTMTKPDAAQGQVAEEGTGKTIAVTYDAKHAPLVAAAPAMLDALEDCRGVLKSIDDQLKGRSIAVTAVLEKARAAIASATNA